MITPVKRFLQNFFGLSRTETNGFLIFLPVFVLVIFSEPMYAWWIDGEIKDSPADKVVLDSLAALWNVKKSTDVRRAPRTEEVHDSKLFAFDPNLVTQAEMKSLGFSPATASRIIHYRAKKGEFHIKSDLMKIYGMDVRLYQKLRVYIQLPDNVETRPLHDGTLHDKFVKERAKEQIKFDLNKADTAELKRIYGIGVKLSERIIKYRQKLGGFVTMEQVTEVYGLDSAVINRLKEHAFITNDFLPTRLNINLATESELNAHPYLTKAAASAIATYRFQHGKFREVNDLRVLHVLSDETIKKIGPYLKFDD